MTFPSIDDHFDAIKAALNAANARPYDFGFVVPASILAYNYLSVTDRFGGTLRSTAMSATRGFRIEIESVGKRDDETGEPRSNVREIRSRADEALREVVLTIGDYTTTPIQFESSDNADQGSDLLAVGDWFSCRTLYTYAI